MPSIFDRYLSGGAPTSVFDQYLTVDEEIEERSPFDQYLRPVTPQQGLDRAAQLMTGDPGVVSQDFAMAEVPPEAQAAPPQPQQAISARLAPQSQESIDSFFTQGQRGLESLMQKTTAEDMRGGMLAAMIGPDMAATTANLGKMLPQVVVGLTTQVKDFTVAVAEGRIADAGYIASNTLASLVPGQHIIKAMQAVAGDKQAQEELRGMEFAPALDVLMLKAISAGVQKIGAPKPTPAEVLKAKVTERTRVEPKVQPIESGAVLQGKAKADHLAELKRKAEAFERKQKARATDQWVDVTPEGFGPGVADATSVEAFPMSRSYSFTLEQQRLQASINEGKTLLRGKVSGARRSAIEKSITSTEAKLEQSLADTPTPPIQKPKPQPLAVTREPATRGDLKVPSAKEIQARRVERLTKDITAYGKMTPKERTAKWGKDNEQYFDERIKELQGLVGIKRLRGILERHMGPFYANMPIPGETLTNLRAFKERHPGLLDKRKPEKYSYEEFLEGEPLLAVTREPASKGLGPPKSAQSAKPPKPVAPAKPPPLVKPKPAVVSKLDKIEADAKARINKRLTSGTEGLRLRMGLDPKVALDVAANLTDLGVIGAAKISRGAVEFAQWSVEMVKDFGDTIKPHLRAIYDRSKRQVASERGDRVFDDFTSYYKEISAPEGYRPPKRSTLVEIKNTLRDDGYRGKELQDRASATFNAQAQREGIALRTTRGGKTVPSVRQSGVGVSAEFANYKGFKDAKAGIGGGTKPPEYYLQEIDGALSAEAKVKLPGQMGPVEKFVGVRTQDMMLQGIDWVNGQKARLEMIYRDVPKRVDRVAVNHVLETLSNPASRLSLDKVAAMPRVKKITSNINVVRAAVEMRHLLEHVLKQQNIARELRSEKLIPRRLFYTAHIARNATLWERMLGETMTPEAMFRKDAPPMPDFINPNAPFNPRAQARKYGLPEDARVVDPLQWGEMYLETAQRDIFNSAIIQNNKAHAMQLESMGFKNAARGIQDWTTESFAGVAGGLDRAFNLPPLAKTIMNRFRQGLARAVFPLNVTFTTFVQPSSTALGVGRYGIGNSLLALGDMIRKPEIRQYVRTVYSSRIKAQRSGSFTHQDINMGVGGGRKINRTTLEIVADAASAYLNTMERMLTSYSVAVGRRYGMSKGFKGTALDKVASDAGAKVQGMYNKENKPGFLRNEIVQTIAPFNTFAFNVVNMVREVMGKTGMPIETVSGRLAAGSRFLAAAMAFNYVSQAAIGRNPWELSSFIPFYGSGPGQLYDALTGQRTTTGARGLPAPVSIAVGSIEALRSLVVKGDWSKLRKWGVKYGTGLTGIPGGIQMSRIVEGWIDAAQEEHQDISGKKLFDVKTPVDKARAIIAGPWTLPQAREKWRREKFDILPDAVWKSAVAKGIIATIPIVSELIGQNKPTRKSVVDRIRKLRDIDGNIKAARALRDEWNKDHPNNIIVKVSRTKKSEIGK